MMDLVDPTPLIFDGHHHKVVLQCRHSHLDALALGVLHRIIDEVAQDAVGEFAAHSHSEFHDLLIGQQDHLGGTLHVVIA